MTTPCYAKPACADESQDRGEALSSPAPWSPADNVLDVNFNNGNCNANDRNNDGWVRAVRSRGRSPGECQGADVSFRDLYVAWKAAQRHKVPSDGLLAFSAAWPERLFALRDSLNAGTWSPGPSTCFVAKAPKAREIHAPSIADRVVHHWLVPVLERIYEPTFVYDSFANRVGKGTHAAVQRLQQFVREVESGQGPTFFLQLDISNFFNSIHRATLWGMLKTRMQRAGLSTVVQRAAHALLRQSPHRNGVAVRATREELALVPANKRLANAAPGCGLPTGNLSSQFLANVYLDALDQFVKHTLRARRYLRYVDDFVIVHEDPSQLRAWKDEIERFLAERLRLRLKDEVRLQRVSDGIDFLGYVVRPRHTLVRRRVVQHARAALAAWGRMHVRNGHVHARPHELGEVAAIWSSYQGHFVHADAAHLVADFHRRFPWLAVATRKRRFAPDLRDRSFHFRFEGQT